jgi:hypothetical protein
LRSHWRRFVPRSALTATAERPLDLDAVTSVEDTVLLTGELKHQPAKQDRAEEAARLRLQLLAQTPTAVFAQAQMDAHKHGYHHREKRLYELIDFNDTFVAYVLASRYAELPALATNLKADMAALCARLGAPMFSDEQYDAIVRGLGREIAVYRSAKYMGFDVHMTSRTEDAFGIDMIITQPETGKVLNIDCKTPPSFRHRLEDLMHHGRISEAELLEADRAGFITMEQRRGTEMVPVTLFCILPDRLGEITNFTFDEPDKLKLALNTIFATSA